MKIFNAIKILCYDSPGGNPELKEIFPHLAQKSCVLPVPSNDMPAAGGGTGINVPGLYSGDTGLR
jgi:hypothetical protein